MATLEQIAQRVIGSGPMSHCRAHGMGIGHAGHRAQVEAQRFLSPIILTLNRDVSGVAGVLQPSEAGSAIDVQR